jgi:hypothetical protein
LVEEEICGKLLVLVTSEVGLDHKIALEAKSTQLSESVSRLKKRFIESTYALNSFALLLGDTDGLSAWGKGGILVGVFGKQLEELLWMRGD